MTTSPTRTAPAIAVGDRIRFTPRLGTGNRWWTVQATDDRYIVATSTLPFGRGECYTVVDRTGYLDRTYNGAGNGMVRSSVNTLGGGWDDLTREGCEQLIADLHSGHWELSHRRIANVREIEVRP